MIDQIDLLLRQFFLARIAQLTDESQIGFEPPNDQWRSQVGNLTVDGDPANAINVYLVDMREKRDLRSNEVERRVVNGLVQEQRTPPRIDLHYVVSAWTPQVQDAAVEPALVEHQLLGQVASVLINGDPLVARQVYAPTPPPGSFPTEVADLPLPMTVLPISGFDDIGDFWSTMEWHWKPVVYFMLSTPFLMDARVAGHRVTTRTLRAFASEAPAADEPFDTMIQIIGQVVDDANPLPDGSGAPLGGALVMIGTVVGVVYETTIADAQGRFTFARLRPGAYRLRASVVGRGQVTRDVQVPAEEYDIRFV